MNSGKLAAQAGHAYTNTLLASLLENPNKTLQYESVGDIGTKICLQAKNLDHLLFIKKQADAQGICNQLITDPGHIFGEHFDGSPIVTALGIGPVTKSQAKFLRKLKLVQ